MKSTLSLQKSIFILDGARGTYIPQNLAEIMVNERHLHTYEFTTDSATLKRMLDELIEGQDNEYYWDNWNDITCHYNEIRKMSTNELFYLTQSEDGDLWLIHEDELEEWNEYESGLEKDYNAFTLIVDLDERGEYQCHIEDCNEDVIWECDTDYVSALQEDGFIRFLPHEDIDALLKYLQSIDQLGQNAKLTYAGSY
jgi:hypothetical protein